jgi:hypothetical protein
MHDTTPNSQNTPFEDTLFKQWITAFDPKKVDPLPTEQAEVPVDHRFFNGSEAEFIREYKHQLAALRLRMQSDYGEIRARYQQQQRRLDTLEGLIPQVRMQQQQLNEVVCDIRAIKRTLTDVKVDVEKQKRSIFGRITSVMDHIWQTLFGA